MLFRMLYDDKLAQASYFIGCQRSNEVLVIDPERDVDRYLEAAAEAGMKITAIAETHIHADFLSGSRELAERTGAKLYLSDEGDADWKYQWLNQRHNGGSYSHQLLRDGESFRLGMIQIKALHTPGHTPEHLSFVVTDAGGGAHVPMGIASGDFVFVGDVGRPDLLETAAGQAGATEISARMLFRSLQRFKELPEFLQVWPAHGAGSACGKSLGAVPQTTVGYEKRFNAAVVESDNEERFIQHIVAGQPDPPYYFARMKHENKMGPRLLGKLPEPPQINSQELQRLVAAKAVLADTRKWPEYSRGHVPGALFAPLNKAFPTIAGSYIEADQPIYLIVAEPRLKEAVIDLIRIGLDNIAGFATPATLAQYREQGGSTETARSIDIRELKERPELGEAVVLDVRGAAEYAAGHLPGALNVAHTRLLPRMPEIPRDRPLLVHCLAQSRSAYAMGFLLRHGFDAAQLAGGFEAWQREGGMIVKD